MAGKIRLCCSQGGEISCVVVCLVSVGGGKSYLLVR